VAGRLDALTPHSPRRAAARCPPQNRLTDFRDIVTERVHARMCDIHADRVELLESALVQWREVVNRSI
jgi:hypothetical protein